MFKIVSGHRNLWVAERTLKKNPEASDLSAPLLSVSLLWPQEMDWWAVRIESDSKEMVQRHAVGCHVLTHALALEMYFPRDEEHEEEVPWRWPLHALPITLIDGPARPMNKPSYRDFMPVRCGEALRLRSTEHIAVRFALLRNAPARWEVNRFPVTLRVCVEGIHYK